MSRTACSRSSPAGRKTRRVENKRARAIELLRAPRLSLAGSLSFVEAAAAAAASPPHILTASALSQLSLSLSALAPGRVIPQSLVKPPRRELERRAASPLCVIGTSAARRRGCPPTRARAGSVEGDKGRSSGGGQSLLGLRLALLPMNAYSSRCSFSGWCDEKKRDGFR